MPPANTTNDRFPKLKPRDLLDLRRAESGRPRMGDLQFLVEVYLIAERPGRGGRYRGRRRAVARRPDRRSGPRRVRRDADPAAQAACGRDVCKYGSGNP